jgi:hypothetical protein
LKSGFCNVRCQQPSQNYTNHNDDE